MNDETYTPCTKCGRPMAYCKGQCCGKTKGCQCKEYGPKVCGAIRPGEPKCPYQAVIPSLTVESVSNLKDLADCFVHVSDINTTFYIDDKHRIMTTWAGLVSVEDYDFVANPLNLRGQIAYDAKNNTAAIYDKQGANYIFQISDIDNNYMLLENKPQINGVTLEGNKSLGDLGITDAIDDAVAEEKAEREAADEAIQDELLSRAVVFDTVADMKSATDLVDGSYTRTLGYHTLNDGGGALYKIRTITNDDVVDESLIVGMGDGTSNLIAELIVEEPVNVKTLGAYGDGTHDDYTKIQHGIDVLHHHTLYFPSGDYLITQPLSIGTTNAEQVDLELDSSATIKTNTTIDSLLEIGKYEGVYDRSAPGNIVTVRGGIFDCNNTTYGIYTTANRKLTTFNGVTLVHVNHYGIYVDTGTNTSNSADVNIISCFASGNGSNYDSTGLCLKAYDNKVSDTRIEGVRVGVEDGGGSFYENVHALMTRANGSITTAEFEATVGFLFNGSGSVFMNECYADTFGTSFKVVSRMRLQVSNSTAYWYYSDANATTKFIAFSSNAGGHISFSDCEFNIPSNGTVKGLDLTGVISSNIRQLATSNIFFFDNILISGDAGKLAKDDYLINRAFYKDNQIFVSKGWATSMTKNAYYPIAYLRDGVFKFDVRMANDQYIEAIVKVNSSSSTITTVNKYNGGHSGYYKLALCNGGNDANGFYGALLCVKAEDSTSYLNPAIIGGLQSWSCDVHSCYNYLGKAALVNPTVVVEASFNP